MILKSLGVSPLPTVVRLLASVIVGAFYVDKIGLVDVNGHLRNVVSGRSTPGGDQR